MRPIIAPLTLLFSAACFAEEIPRAIQVAEPPKQAAGEDADRVFSATKQFRISGGESLERGNSALLSEEAKKELMALTGEKDEWKIPISIRLHGKKGDPLPARTVSLSLLVVEGVSELKIDYHLSLGLEPERFKRAVTTALLYERSLRDPSKGGAERDLDVPPWLADGLREATAWKLNQSDLRLYKALFKQGGLFKIDQLFAISDADYENMDAATRAAFRISSGALVMALLEQPQGKEGFRSFLTELAAYEGEMPVLLRKHFPELNLSETSLAKWWALQLANKGAVNLLTDVQTIQETEAALVEALRLDIRTPEGITQQNDLTAWPELAALKEPDRVAAVHLAQEALVRMSYRCFPSYRPLLFDYQQILDALAKNKTKDIAARLATLDETRVTMLARSTRARDYLDWFEITRARETSGAFDDYLRLKERLKANPHQRKDDWSKYLDQMDAIFYREQSENSAQAKP